MSARPRISAAQRRARLLRRHLLDGSGGHHVTQVADAMVALHATIPSTVHLSAWARGGAPEPDCIEKALYDDRSLVKQLVMRRTLFVMTRPVLAAAVSAVGTRVAASERTNMLRDLRREDGPADPEEWLVRGREAVLAEFADGAAYPASELRKRLPDFDLEIMRDEGKAYGGPSPMLPRLLNMMAANGDVVRGPNAAQWHGSRPSWTAMGTWLGEPLVPLGEAAGHAVMVERWLRRYGPGTETDLVWWLGTTKTAVRAALASLDVTEVDLERSGADGQATGYLMSDDLADVDPVEPRALLLPGLDPTTMGWKERGFYVGEHTSELFDRNGNGGQTAWWDGRIVGGWIRTGGNSSGPVVRVVPLEDLPPAASRALDRRAEELTDWLGEASFAPRFPSPLMTRHR